MAELKVEVLKIEKIIEHPNADRLDLATVLGYQVVVGRGQYEPGDCAVYFPVDSILPSDLQAVIFAGSKMKLSRNRVRAAHIRGAMSFGLLVEIPTIKQYYLKNASHKIVGVNWKEGKDLTAKLAVTKYEPPTLYNTPTQTAGSHTPKRHCHPLFSKYTDIQHGKKCVRAWESYDKAAVLLEKIHGTNFRCGWVPRMPRTWLGKLIKKIQDLLTANSDSYEFVYGSHNVQLQDGNPKKGAPAFDNVYKRAVEIFDLKARIRPNELWYFEIYGPGIQTNYGYGLPEGDIGLVVIDIKMLAEGGRPRGKGYLPWFWTKRLAEVRGLVPAPIILHDKKVTPELIDFVINGAEGQALKSKLGDTTPIEGGVLRPYAEEVETYTGRFVFKFLSDEYLLNKNNTDFH